MQIEIKTEGDLIVSKTAPLVITDEFIDRNRHVNYNGHRLYFERQRNGLMVTRGIDFKRMEGEYNLICVVGGDAMRNISAANEGDNVTIQTDGYLRSDRKLTFHQVMRKEDSDLVDYLIVNYFMNTKLGRSQSLPQELIDLLSRPEEDFPEGMRYLEAPESFPHHSLPK